MTRTPSKPPLSRDPNAVYIYRLDLPEDIGRLVISEAEKSERTLPGQIRFVLRQWAERECLAQS